MGPKSISPVFAYSCVITPKVQNHERFDKRRKDVWMITQRIVLI
jgi:hypothetical protein